MNEMLHHLSLSEDETLASPWLALDIFRNGFEEGEAFVNKILTEHLMKWNVKRVLPRCNWFKIVSNCC